jgi:hypothetical protein
MCSGWYQNSVLRDEERLQREAVRRRMQMSFTSRGVAFGIEPELHPRPVARKVEIIDPIRFASLGWQWKSNVGA